MRVEALYTATFTTPEAWSVERPGAGGERQSFLIAEGRCSGRIAGRVRAANYPRGRPDNVLLPDFRGVLETDDGATVLFAWRGYARPSSSGRELVGSITHVSDDMRYSWLNDVVGVVTGEVRREPGGDGSEVVIEVAEIVWEPVSAPRP
jgi:Protein of unknown function (DUF3237)